MEHSACGGMLGGVAGGAGGGGGGDDGGNDGGNNGGCGGGGNDGDEIEPQMVKPVAVTDPSVDHDIICPALMLTPLGPEVPT